jgi:hypothetical protein
MKDDGVDE